MAAMLIISMNSHLPPPHSQALLVPPVTETPSPFSSISLKTLPGSSLSTEKFSSNVQKSQVTFLGLRLSQSRGLFQCNTLTAIDGSADIVTDSGNALFSLLLEMGINQKEIEAMLENHPALKLLPFESIRTRINGLQNLKINGLVLGGLIKKRPDVLITKEVDSLVCFLSDDLKGMIKVAQIERLFSSTDPRLLSGFEARVKLLLSHEIPRDKLAHVLNNVNLTKALCLKSSEDIERMMAFLNRFDGVELILRRPAIINYDLETQLIPRVRFLLELSGGNDVATAAVLRRLPFILAYSVDHLKEHVELLRSYAGLSDEQIFKITHVYPNLFSVSRKRKLQPRIDFLKQCGLSSNDIFKFLVKSPLFLSQSFEGNLAFKLAFLLKIGYQHRTKELAVAMGATTRCSCKNLQQVFSLLLNYGLSCEDILAMAKKHHQILQYNHKSLKVKLDYLTGEMGRELGELLSFPAFLGYEFDGRIKHRFETKGKNMGEAMSINKLLSMSTATFAKKKSKKKPPVEMLIKPSQGEVNT